MATPNITGWLSPEGKFYSIGGTLSDHDDVAAHLVNENKWPSHNPRGEVERRGYLWINMGSVSNSGTEKLTRKQKDFICERYAGCMEELPQEIQRQVEDMARDKPKESRIISDRTLAVLAVSGKPENRELIKRWRHNHSPGG